MAIFKAVLVEPSLDRGHVLNTWHGEPVELRLREELPVLLRVWVIDIKGDLLDLIDALFPHDKREEDWAGVGLRCCVLHPSVLIIELRMQHRPVRLPRQPVGKSAYDPTFKRQQVVSRYAL